MDKTNQEYTFYASQTRGVLINHIILLERAMDRYMCNYFCQNNEKAVELMDLVMSTRRITFESKAQVFRCILDKVFPDKKKEHQQLAADFQYVAEERNMLAHFFLDPSAESLQRYLADKTTITLLKFEKIRTREIFDFERVKRLGAIITKYSELLIELI